MHILFDSIYLHIYEIHATEIITDLFIQQKIIGSILYARYASSF